MAEQTPKVIKYNTSVPINDLDDRHLVDEKKRWLYQQSGLDIMKYGNCTVHYRFEEELREKHTIYRLIVTIEPHTK